MVDDTPGGYDLKKYFGQDKAVEYDEGILKRIPGYHALHNAGLALLEAGLKPEARILVVGAGTGHELIRCAQARPGWSLVGVDPSEAMLALAKAKVEGAGLGGRVALHHGTADSLALGAGFDAGTCLLVSHFLKDDGSKLRLFRSIAEHLKPGAPLLLADQLGEPGSAHWEWTMRAWEQAQVNAGMPADEAAERVGRSRGNIHFVGQARYLALLAEAGFRDPMSYWRGLHFEAWAALKA